MDLVKIGSYIAEKRKKLGMTQKQLAEKLGKSDIAQMGTWSFIAKIPTTKHDEPTLIHYQL